MIKFGSKKSSLLLATAMLAKLASAQGLPWLDDAPAQTSLAQDTSSDQTQLLQTMAPQVATTTDPSTVTIPAGTRVLMVLKSPLHTTSGTAGSGLSLETLYPVGQAQTSGKRALRSSVANLDRGPAGRKPAKRMKHQRAGFGTINPFKILVPLDWHFSVKKGPRSRRPYCPL